MNNSSDPEIDNLIAFLQESPTAWHAVAWMLDKLENQGFEILQEQNSWEIQPGKAYVVSRQGSSLCAFVTPTDEPRSVKVIGAHTDSPTFKLKPNAEFKRENMLMLGLEIYGSPLLTSWLNRDLGIAGKVVYKNSNDQLEEALVKLEDFPVIIPQLAIHLDRQVNDNGLVLNKQNHLAALVKLLSNSNQTNPSEDYLKTLLQQKLNFQSLLAYDLFVYPLERPRLIGGNHEMLSSYRIDNLASVCAALNALVHSQQPDSHALKMIVFWDHEEIGSETLQGAASPFFQQTLERISIALNSRREEYFKMIQNGICLSVDMAHALHPNYPERSEPYHQLLMDGGIVIKNSAQHRYATNAWSAGCVIDLCKQNNIPYQHFISRGDIPAGTTIGPIFASRLGMQTVDIGCPQLSMHSCRELFSCQDHKNMCRLLTAYFK
jgi:aspartyl aminopeptidase